MGFPNDNNRGQFRNGNGAVNRGRGQKEPPKPSPERTFLEGLIEKYVVIERRGGHSSLLGVLKWNTEHTVGLHTETGDLILVMKGDISTIGFVKKT
jgi:hypothetical protein